jgi:hypothetical protein
MIRTVMLSNIDRGIIILNIDSFSNKTSPLKELINRSKIIM